MGRHEANDNAQDKNCRSITHASSVQKYIKFNAALEKKLNYLVEYKMVYEIKSATLNVRRMRSFITAI